MATQQPITFELVPDFSKLKPLIPKNEAALIESRRFLDEAFSKESKVQDRPDKVRQAKEKRNDIRRSIKSNPIFFPFTISDLQS
jgi:hypothetical protein